MIELCASNGAEGPATCAAKVVDLPGEGTDEKTLLDLYSEISILEKFHGVPYICDLYDYGITHESAYLVMKEYKCSLLVCNKNGINCVAEYEYIEML